MRIELFWVMPALNRVVALLPLEVVRSNVPPLFIVTVPVNVLRPVQLAAEGHTIDPVKLVVLLSVKAKAPNCNIELVATVRAPLKVVVAPRVVVPEFT